MKMLFLFVFAATILVAADPSSSPSGAEKKTNNTFGCSKTKCQDEKGQSEQDDNIELLLSPFHI